MNPPMTFHSSELQLEGDVDQLALPSIKQDLQRDPPRGRDVLQQRGSTTIARLGVFKADTNRGPRRPCEAT